MSEPTPDPEPSTARTVRFSVEGPGRMTTADLAWYLTAPVGGRRRADMEVIELLYAHDPGAGYYGLTCELMYQETPQRGSRR